MDVILTFFRELSLISRILVLVAIALGGHLLVKLVHRIGNRIMAPEAAGPYAIARGRPKVASITTTNASTARSGRREPNVRERLTIAS